MRRIGLIAEREFLGTVLTRGFIVGVLVVPAVMALAFALGPRLMNQRSAPVRGQIAVIDPTGAVMAELRATITPAAIAARREEAARRALAAVPAGVRDLAGAAATAPSSDAIERIAGTVPDLQVIDRPADAGDPDMRAAKAWLTDAAPGDRHIALVVVQPDAVTRAPGRIEYGTYELYVPLNLDDRIETSIFESLREAIINARVRAQHLDRVSLDEIARVPRARSVTVTKDSERVTVGAFNRIMPFAFVGLLLVSVLMGGQGLMMSTVEEKTSRVIEVLLSAVSPFELLAGKIVGQMAVSLVVLGLYIVLAFMLLASFAMFGLLDLSLVFYLLIFFVITYVTIGAAMAAVGSAVNEMREAQSLMMPIMLVLMVPWVLAAPIAREPNSTFSTAISFTPPVNTFAMLLRLASSAPPPSWQVWVTIAIGLVSVVGSVWCASQVFTIGLLMHGKPPDLKTLVRWIREA
ncbi:MAG TPA: ABC transporter permease [Vicinamibacterales bacterium]|jgi:ABC-type Na+ efflux pump permease subunit|nr:ABC transporter permease [Vicinamibacterales bacterium]